MAFTKTLILALVCLFSISSFVQETGARDVQLRNLGRSLAQADGLESHSEISAADPNDDNEGDEGNEGNEGTLEGDEGGQPGGDPEGEGSVPGAGDGDDGGDGGDMGGDDGGDGGDMGGDDGGDGGDMGGDDGGDGGDMGGDDGGDGGDMGGDDGGDGGDMGGDDGGDGGDGGDMGEDGGDGGDGGDMGGDGGDGGDGADGGDEEMPAEEMPAGDEGTPDAAADTAGAEEATPGEEEEMPAEEEPAAGAAGAEEDTPAEEDAAADEAPAEEEDDDGTTTAAAAGAAAAGAGAAAAGAAVAAGGDEDDEETAMAPTIVPGDAFAPGPAGTRDFDFGDVAEGPAQCTTLRDGLVNASPVLQSALPSIAPLGDTSTLATALDDPTLNVTVLLPDETILTQLGALLTSPDAAAVTPEQVQEILLDHILAMPLEAAELIELGSGMVDLITGEEIDLDVDGGVVMFTLNNITATVTEPDVEGCAGESVIHRIDAIFADLPAAGSVDEGTRELPGDVEEEGAAGSFASFAVPAVATALAAVFML